MIKAVFIYQRKKEYSFYYLKVSNFSEVFTNENYHLHLVFTDANLERNNLINS